MEKRIEIMQKISPVEPLIHSLESDFYQVPCVSIDATQVYEL